MEKNIVDEILRDDQPSKSDPLGMWTGKPADPNAVPVQDADDL